MHWMWNEGLAAFIVGGVEGGVIFAILIAVAIRLDRRKAQKKQGRADV
jgi:hypothetical protein